MLAPIPTIAASIALATWAKHDPNDNATRNVVRRDELPESRNVAPPAAPLDLTSSCEEAAARLRNQLGRNCSVLIQAPLVLAGDMSNDQLQRAYARTIQPAMSAMLQDYFDAAPNEPVTLLLFNHETTYTRFAEELFGQKDISIYGYYKPASRTLILNLGTGGGTLVHELTHALVDFDFPTIPIWFNEGLASLHEQCRFVEDASTGLHIEGLANWRLPILKEAITNDTRGSLRQLVTTPQFLGQHEAINYAHARYLCMFLQERGLLAVYYRAFRANAESDPQGEKTLITMFPGYDWQELDHEFLDWVTRLRR